MLDALDKPVAGAPVLVGFLQAEPGPAKALAAPFAARDSICIGCGPGFQRYLAVVGNPFAYSVRFQFAIPDTAHVAMTIADRSGTKIRTLFDRQFQGGVYSVLWDGIDDAGGAVPNGLYTATWVDDEGDSTFTQHAAVLRSSSDPSVNHDVLADAHGRFAIPIASLPIGATVAGSDEAGNSTGDFTVAPIVEVCASRAPGDPTGTVCGYVSLGDLRHTVRDTLTLTPLVTRAVGLARDR